MSGSQGRALSLPSSDTWARFTTIALLAACFAGFGPAASAAERSRAARAAFQRLNPCPATGLPRGACPGYVVDHVEPLCAGGLDDPVNMQWQTVEEAKIKDREERRLCARR